MANASEIVTHAFPTLLYLIQPATKQKKKKERKSWFPLTLNKAAIWMVMFAPWPLV